MLALLLALQISTTNCIPDYSGGYHCMTMNPPGIPPIQAAPIQSADQDWVAIFETGRRNHRNKTAGKMLSNGDCAGAEKYALETGDFPLVSTVRAYCADPRTRHVVAQAPSPPVVQPAVPEPLARKVRAKTRSGYCLDVPESYMGTGAENSPAVTSAMPRCDQLTAR
jgi:hypothetical protein